MLCQDMILIGIIDSRSLALCWLSSYGLDEELDVRYGGCLYRAKVCYSLGFFIPIFFHVLAISHEPGGNVNWDVVTKTISSLRLTPLSYSRPRNYN